MFLEKELKRYNEIGAQPQAVADAIIESTQATPSTQSTALIDLGSFRFVDLLNTWDVDESAPLYLLVSDGNRQAVAVAARSVYEPFKQQIDSDYDVHRLILIRHMGFVPWKRELLPKELADFTFQVNGCAAVLKISVMQLRGGAWLSKTTGPRPPRQGELGPLPERQPSSQSPFIPLTFHADRPQQFAPIQYSDEESFAHTVHSDSEPVPSVDNIKPLNEASVTKVITANGDDNRDEQETGSESSIELQARLRYESEVNLEQLIMYGERQGASPLDEDVALPEVLSQAPSQMMSQAFSQASPQPPLPGHISSDTSTPLTNEEDSWTESQEKALVFGIVYTHGANWEQIMELYGPNGTMGDDLKDKTMHQLDVKASFLKRELIKDGKKLPPGFDSVSLFPADSQSHHKKQKTDDSSQFSMIQSDTPDESSSDKDSDTSLNSQMQQRTLMPDAAFGVASGTANDVTSLSRIASSSQSLQGSKVVSSDEEELVTSGDDDEEVGYVNEDSERHAIQTSEEDNFHAPDPSSREQRLPSSSKQDVDAGKSCHIM